jgi:hypothetical protein
MKIGVGEVYGRREDGKRESPKVGETGVRKSEFRRLATNIGNMLSEKTVAGTLRAHYPVFT